MGESIEACDVANSPTTTSLPIPNLGGWTPPHPPFESFQELLHGCFPKWWYPQSIILIGFSIINHPFWGTRYPYFWKHPYIDCGSLISWQRGNPANSHCWPVIIFSCCETPDAELKILTIQNHTHIYETTLNISRSTKPWSILLRSPPHSIELFQKYLQNIWKNRQKSWLVLF